MPASWPRSTVRTQRVLEAAAGIGAAALVVWTSVSGWRFYNDYLLPSARTVPTATPSPVPDPEAIRAQARQMRQVVDLVGAGIALRQAGQRDAAIRSFQQALALDPANHDARQNLAEMGVDPATLGIAAVATRTVVGPAATPPPTVTPRA